MFRTGKYNRVAPVRERGLKSDIIRKPTKAQSRSREGAWIEINGKYELSNFVSVAPVRERGLKCSPTLERLWPYGSLP